MLLQGKPAHCKFLYALSVAASLIKLRVPAGPGQLWLIGNLLDFAEQGDHEYLLGLHKRFGDVFKVALVTPRLLLLLLC